MKKVFENRWLTIVVASLIVVLGVLTFVFALVNDSIVDNVISYSLAASFFIVGLIYMLTALIAHTSDFFTVSLVLGSICVAFGIVLCIVPSVIGLYLTYFVASLLLALGTMFLIKTVLLIVCKQRGSWIALYIFATLICIAGGILVFCYLGAAKKIIYCIIGASVVVCGALLLGYGIKKVSKSKSAVAE